MQSSQATTMTVRVIAGSPKPRQAQSGFFACFQVTCRTFSSTISQFCIPFSSIRTQHVTTSLGIMVQGTCAGAEQLTGTS